MLESPLRYPSPSRGAGHRPTWRRRAERRVGFLAVVDVVAIAAVLVAAIEQGLQIEGDVAVVATEGDRDRRQPFAEGDPIELDLERLPAPTHTGGIGRAVALGDAIEGNGQDTRAGPEQVDLDQADPPARSSSCFLTYRSLPGPATLFDGLRISITETTRLPDLMSMISMKPCRTGSDPAPGGRPSGSATAMPLLVRQRSVPRPPALDDPHIGDDVSAPPSADSTKTRSSTRASRSAGQPSESPRTSM